MPVVFGVANFKGQFVRSRLLRKAQPKTLQLFSDNWEAHFGVFLFVVCLVSGLLFWCFGVVLLFFVFEGLG